MLWLDSNRWFSVHYLSRSITEARHLPQYAR
jgi:hypothetical protein